jgi:hypothetical protein
MLSTRLLNSSVRSLRPNMPLRAKITAPGFRAYSSQMDPDDVLFQSNYGVRTIELNRPAKYNALNGSMISKIRPRLQVPPTEPFSSTASNRPRRNGKSHNWPTSSS